MYTPGLCTFYHKVIKGAHTPVLVATTIILRKNASVLRVLISTKYQDLHVEVVPVNFSELTNSEGSERSEDIRKRVISARKIQESRFEKTEGLHSNAQMGSKEVQEVCQISELGNTLLKKAMEKLNLSARAYDRILKVSRTIADLAQSDEILPEHIAEAIHFRSLDRENWGSR